jgi:Cu2+-exporting ATPase
VPSGVHYSVEIEGEPRPMCCKGCEAVAHAIVDSGLVDFYRHRSTPSPTARELVPEFLRETTLYDYPQVQRSFVTDAEDNVKEASLIIQGIVCAACVWLNERHVARLPGVLEIQINYATHRARVRWDDSRVHLSDILQAIASIGYTAHPYDPGRQQQLLEEERRGALRRLLLAGLLGMQIMMLAVALYAGDFFGIEPQFRRFFAWVSLVLAAPVLLFSARPFFQAAWRDLRRRSVGMDVPVALGIALAFAASAWATLRGEGAVYFDSVAMFVFFLLAARYFELAARKRAAESSEALVQTAPTLATRVVARDGTETEEEVPAFELSPGDRVRVRPGETVPADGEVVSGHSSVDESVLTGESVPVPKGPGFKVIGGAINVESPLTVTIEHTGEDTVLSAILRLLDRAQTEKPRLAQLADRAASWFVGGVLVLAAAVALYWWRADPPRPVGDPGPRAGDPGAGHTLYFRQDRDPDLGAAAGDPQRNLWCLGAGG